MDGHSDDGGGRVVCPHPRLRFAPHAARLWHDDRHIRVLRAGDAAVERPQQDMRQYHQHHCLGQWFHISDG